MQTIGINQALPQMTQILEIASTAQILVTETKHNEY